MLEQNDLGVTIHPCPHNMEVCCKVCEKLFWQNMNQMFLKKCFSLQVVKNVTIISSNNKDVIQVFPVTSPTSGDDEPSTTKENTPQI